MSLRRKTTLYICIILVSFVLISIMVIYHESNKILQNEAERYMESQLERVNENVKLLLNNIVLETEKLSYDSKIDSYFSGKSSLEGTGIYLASLMKTMNQTQPLFMDLFLVDLNGIIVSAAMEEAIGVDVSSRAYFQKTIESNIANTSDIILSRADNTQIIITLAPTTNGNDIVIGYTGIAIYATYFSNFLDNFSIKDSSKYIIIDSFDKIVSHPNKKLISSKFDYHGYPKDEFKSIRSIVTDNGSYQVIVRNLHFNDWKVISYLKDSDIYSKSIELSYKFLYIGIVFIVIAIGLGIYAIDVISKPIVKITESINRIIEDEKRFQTNMIQHLPFDYLINSETDNDESMDSTEVSNFRKAILGFKSILEQGAKNFDLEYNQLKIYLDSLYFEIGSINNRNLDFIATLSHDIRTPLTLIKGYARGLESGDITDEAMKKKFESGIVKSSNDIENLVYNVLDFAYEVNLNSSYQMKLYEVDYVIKEIVFELKQLYENKITMEVDDFSVDSNKVLIDLMNIKRVITNLVNNSVKYTNLLDLVRIRISNSDEGIHFEIYDEGIGIKGEELSRIFELFYRTFESKDKKGYGLGLYISNQILINHEAELICNSVYGEYTSMKFFLKYKNICI